MGQIPNINDLLVWKRQQDQQRERDDRQNEHRLPLYAPKPEPKDHRK